MKNEIEVLKEKWAKAIVEADLKALSKLYSNEAILKPTMSNSVRKGFDEISPYFVGGGKNEDPGFFNQGISEVRYLNSECFNSATMYTEVGSYEFVTPEKKLNAHYSFVFSLDDKDWKIVAHHSSYFV